MMQSYTKTATEQMTITAFCKGKIFIQLYTGADGEDYLDSISRLDFEKWLVAETDELEWHHSIQTDFGVMYDGIQTISLEAFWDYSSLFKQRILDRLTEYYSQTLQTA